MLTVLRPCPHFWYKAEIRGSSVFEHLLSGSCGSRPMTTWHFVVEPAGATLPDARPWHLCSEGCAAMEIRAIRDAEFDTFLAVTEDAFGEPPSKEGAERVVLRASLELDRTRAAYGGKRQVGSSAAYSLQVSVRGGSAAMAGISWVGVAPGHRRRGVLRAMMTALMDQAREREEPLAGLYASEWPIYGRFGFGMAVPQATIRVSLASARRGGTRDAEAAEAADEAVAVVDAAEAAPLLAPVYEAVAAQRSGITSRSEDWWRIVLHDFSEDPPAATAG